MDKLSSALALVVIFISFWSSPLYPAQIEVWVGQGNSSDILRYDTAGNSLGSFTSLSSTVDLEVVGNEVWEPVANLIYRYDTSGNFLSSINTSGSNTVLQVVEVAPVPIPPALYLFGTGFLGLVGMARRKKA